MWTRRRQDVAQCFAIAVAAAGATTCSPAHVDSAESPATRGERLYAETCVLCHGSGGEGYRADDAPRLAGQELLSTASDAFLRRAILDGRPGTTMSAWSRERGGPLTEEDADGIVAYLRTLQTEPDVPLDARSIGGDPNRGRAVFETECRGCHGENGENGRYIQLANPVFLASASDAYVRAAIERGRAGTPMEAFRGRLTSQTIDDLVALARSWQRPVDGPESLPPRPGGLVDVVVNPSGQDPGWDAASQFISVDRVKQAMDEGASFVLADARPPSDYSGGHITRAVSVPFFEVDAYLSEIPKTKFVITYCACPHAESGVAATIFRARGYSRVAVLDEGFKLWRARGYPVRSGAKP